MNLGDILGQPPVSARDQRQQERMQGILADERLLDEDVLRAFLDTTAELKTDEQGRAYWDTAPTNSLNDIAAILAASNDDSRIRSWIYDKFAGRGHPRAGASAARLADWMPIVGTGTGLEDMRNDFRDGNYIMAGVNALGAAADLWPIAGKAADGISALARVDWDNVGRAARQFPIADDGAIRAWHGSPHDFDEFSLDARGTGTGAQAFGDGHYFADEADRALSYRDRLRKPSINGASIYASGLSDDAQELVWKFVAENDGGTLKDVAEFARSDLAARQADLPYSAVRHYNEIISELDAMPDATIKMPGHMYEVQINANPEDFLPWEAQAPWGNGETVGDYFRSRQDVIGNKAATQEIADKGYPGISVNIGASGSKDYAVFNDRLIDILGKDGARNTPEGRAQDILDMLASGRASEVTDEMLDMGDPVLNARLNEYLFKNYDLPMDAQSRMARAGEMGYNVADTAPTATSAVEARGGASVANPPSARNTSDISGVDNAGISVAKAAGGPDLYHGTAHDVAAFDGGRFGSGAGSWSGDGVYTTPDALEAEEYGDIIMPLLSRGKTPNRQILRDYNWSAPDGYSQHLAGQGYDATEMWVRDVDDRTGEIADEWLKERVDFNPANIRSRFARFDPRLAHLRNLSAGAAGTAMLGDYLTPDQREAELRAYLGM